MPKDKKKRVSMKVSKIPKGNVLVMLDPDCTGFYITGDPEDPDALACAIVLKNLIDEATMPTKRAPRKFDA